VSHRYGWVPDTPDARDSYRAPAPRSKRFPRLFNWRKNWPQILNQGPLGSCVLNGLSSQALFGLAKQSVAFFQPSRLFNYYNTRGMEGTIQSDAGCMPRDAIKAHVKYGMCDEKLWPYDVAKFTQKPPLACYREALKHQLLQYSKVRQGPDSKRVLRDMKQCLMDGYPFGAGIMLYDSFESSAVAKTGIVPMPNFNREAALGGHYVVVAGWDEGARMFEIVNSWGTGWGDKGWFRLPYDYLLNPDLADDFWSIRMVEA